MEKYDEIVVGSGSGGLTAAALLGSLGHRVLLLEKKTRIGGSLARFSRGGVPFDVGLHFTGGLCSDGILDEMLRVLGMREHIVPLFLSIDHANRFVFESDGASFDMPAGVDRLHNRMKDYFPSESEGIDRYFAMVQHVCDQTPSMTLRSLGWLRSPLDEDCVSLQEALDGLFRDQRLKALLSGFSMCYGTRPNEVSFANHSRTSYNIYESVARVERGGDAFLAGFSDRLAELPVEIRCGTTIARCEEVKDRVIQRFVLTSGEEVSCETCIMTIYPEKMLDLLPRQNLSPAFIQRVSSFEPSSGFFALFGVVDETEPFDPTIISLLPCDDINEILDPDLKGDSALVLLRSLEQVRDTFQQAVTILQPTPFSRCERWQNTQTGKRPPDYQEYKMEEVNRIRERIAKIIPSYRKALKVLDSASILTFRDHLLVPQGAAFGVKQKMGQINIFGRLPLRNVWVAGQSAILPGVIGAMMSSFLVVRSLVGQDLFDDFISRRLNT